MDDSGINDEMNVLELEVKIGVSEEHTNEIMYKLSTSEYLPSYLRMYNLLLLERYDETVPLIKRGMESDFNIVYIESLQNSRFWAQRRCVPQISMSGSCDDRKKILLRSLSDCSHMVVNEAIEAIMANNPFCDDELRNIAINLFDNNLIRNRVRSVDLMACLKPVGDLLERAVNDDSWLMRVRCAMLLKRFGEDEQNLIIERLREDSVEEVRIELAKNLNRLEYAGYLNDPSSQVRGAYLSNVIGEITDEALLTQIIENNAWEIGKLVLGIKGDLFKKISMTLIERNYKGLPWRKKLEMVDLIEKQLDDSKVAKMLMEFLFEGTRDKVFLIRQRIAELLKIIILRYDWIVDYEKEFREIINSTNYLHRLTIVPVIIAYDKKNNTNLSEALKNDKIANVRIYYNKCLE